MSNIRIVVDGNKLERIIARGGYNINDLSENMGFNRGYLTDVIRSGKISVPGSKTLEALTGIKVDDYAVVESKEKEEPTKVEVNNDELINNTKLIGNLLMQILEGQQKTNKYLAYIASQVKEK